MLFVFLKYNSCLLLYISRVRGQRCQIAEVQNSRGFGMQQTERRRTDLARSTNDNIQNQN